MKRNAVSRVAQQDYHSCHTIRMQLAWIIKEIMNGLCKLSAYGLYFALLNLRNPSTIPCQAQTSCFKQRVECALVVAEVGYGQCLLHPARAFYVLRCAIEIDRAVKRRRGDPLEFIRRILLQFLGRTKKDEHYQQRPKDN